MSTRTHMDRFISYLASERRFAEETVEGYRRDVHAANVFLKARGKDVATATLDDIREYLVSCSQAGNAAATLVRHIAAIRCFLKFLGDPNKVADGLEAPKGEQRLPNFLSEAQAALLLEQPNASTLLGVRDQAMLELLYGCGLRASELCGLRTADVDLAQGQIKVLGKGSKERLLPLNAKAVAAVAAYLARRPAGGPESLFLSYRGEPLNRVALWHIVVDYAQAAGIPKHVHPHMLRHSFASHMLSGGAGLRTIQEMLGHESVETTERYVHVDLKRLKNMHALLGR